MVSQFAVDIFTLGQTELAVFFTYIFIPLYSFKCTFQNYSP